MSMFSGLGRRINSFCRSLAGALPRRGRGGGQLSLRLEFKGKVLYEKSDFSAADAITVGRSSECVWVIPPEDNVASGHHAVILMHNGRLCLRDTGSRNGIFYKAKRIQEKVLAPDDQFSIGSCTLFVERVRTARTAPHQLVFLNTDRKGGIVKLDRPKMAAGSAPGGDIVIDEPLVSQKHAEFDSKADGCWLRDLGSKNGTFVNGTRLSPSTERLLADDDVVSLAFVDFKFVDGRVEHSQIRIWYSLGIVAATVFVVLLVNWLWMGLKSSSDSCLGYARAEAAAGNFGRAREYLKESRTRRGAENNEVTNHELEQSVAVWENIHRSWISAKAALNAGNWVESSRILGMITDADPNVWGWNDTSAPLMRKEAFAVKKLLDAFLLAETSMRDDRNRKNLADLKRAAAVIAGMERLFAQKHPPYLKKLLAASAALRRQVDENLQYLESWSRSWRGSSRNRTIWRWSSAIWTN
ncbi:MAG: FHA domain-containing protein [Lentisphaeria bacterium]|nr:FHA domain-containing protein [Lentisphaeria bacterium]